MTKEVKIGNIRIGGNNPVAIQSMLNTDSHDITACVKQARELEGIGCEIVRLAVPDEDCLKTVSALKENISIPVVADIHFSHRLAIESVYAGADKIRINPGNIGDDVRVKEVVDVCREKNIPIRVGVNSGSLERSILKKYGGVTPEALAESALYSASLIEKYDYDNIVISVKSASVRETVEVNRLLSAKTGHPLHIGVTEAGTLASGIVKSSVGIGALLLDGIGDTIRVSLTADPMEEIYAAKRILNAVGMGKGINVVACPTCGRTKVDLINVANAVEREVSNINKKLTVAVMGCAVNGPGEAKNADIGIAGGDNEWLLIKQGEVIGKVCAENAIERLIEEIKNMQD